MEHIEPSCYYVSVTTKTGDSLQDNTAVIVYLRSVIVHELHGIPGGLIATFKQWTFPLEYAETPTRALRKIYGVKL